MSQNPPGYPPPYGQGYPPQYVVVRPAKETGVAYGLLLLSLIGVAGIHYFYLGKIGLGILWLLTWGLFGIGTFVDLFTLPGQVRTVNARIAAGVY